MSSGEDLLGVALVYRGSRMLLPTAAISLILLMPFHFCVTSDLSFDVKENCILGNDTSCPELHCCVKHVITYKDPSKDALVGTKCESLLQEDALCLRSPEGYMCDCRPGLHCAMQSFETFGYCKRLPRRV